RRDIDLLIVSRDAPPKLFKNLRDGTFRDVAADVGLGAIADGDEITGVAAADLNKDGFPDFVFTRTASASTLAVSDGRGRFTTTPAADSSRGAAAAQIVDYDNDGLLDLFTWSGDGPRMLRNVGRAWRDTTATAFPRATAGLAPASARSIVWGDVNSDGG